MCFRVQYHEHNRMCQNPFLLHTWSITETTLWKFQFKYVFSFFFFAEIAIELWVVFLFYRYKLIFGRDHNYTNSWLVLLTSYSNFIH